VVVSYQCEGHQLRDDRGTGGAAVQFNDASDVLVVEGGCAFVGAVLGGWRDALPG